MPLMLYMAGPPPLNHIGRLTEDARVAAARAASNRAGWKMHFRHPRGIVRLSSDLAPAGATTPNTSASRIEITIEQRVTTEVETADPRPQCAVERTVAGKCDTGTPRSDDDRGDRYLQTVEAACLEKVRDRDPAALDEYDRQSPVTQRGADRRNIERAADARHAKDFAPMRLAPAVAMLLCGDDQCRSRAVAKDRMPAGQAQLRIDDDPERVVSGATPDRQLRVVGPHGAGTDEDSVGERPHAMAMQEVGLAGDPAGFAVVGRNSAVEALPDMSDGKPAGVRNAIRKIKVELYRDVIRQRRRCTPPATNGDAERSAMEWNRNQLRAGPRRERRARGEHGRPPERIAWLAPSIRLSPGGMIPISEKSSGGPLVDWVPEGHDRKYTEPAAMSIRIAATPSAWFTLMREARPASATRR